MAKLVAITDAHLMLQRYDLWLDGTAVIHHINHSWDSAIRGITSNRKLMPEFHNDDSMTLA